MCLGEDDVLFMLCAQVQPAMERSDMAALHVRGFSDPDWPQAWAIIRAVSAAGDTFTYPVDLAEDQARGIWIRPPPGRTAVAVDSRGSVLGTSQMGPNKMGPGGHVATASFMVADGHRGSGVGRRLVLDALEWAGESGYRGMQFNAVAETNRVAIALYRALGFEIVGTVPEGFLHPQEGYVSLCIMYKPLG